MGKSQTYPSLSTKIKLWSCVGNSVELSITIHSLYPHIQDKEVRVGNFHGGANTICPYYIKEAEKSITCESTIEGAANMLRFVTRELKEEYQHDFCECFCYRGCPVAQLMEERFKEEKRDNRSRRTIRWKD